MNSDIRPLMRVKYCLWNHHKVSGDQAIFKEFKLGRNQFVSKIHFSKDLQSTKKNEVHLHEHFP